MKRLYKSTNRVSKFIDFSITMKIHTLDKDLASGRQCMECLTALLRRLLPLERTEWLEQTLVTRVYLTGKYPQTQGADGVKNMRRLLDGTECNL
jgi:hypothetical protein